MTGQDLLFQSLGVDLATKQKTTISEKWVCYNLNHNSPARETPIILIQSGPKNISEIKKELKNLDAYVVFFEQKEILFLKSANSFHMTTFENDSEYRRIIEILKTTKIAKASNYLELQVEIKEAIDKIPDSTSDFVNKGLFSTHYLRSRIFDDTRQKLDDQIKIFQTKSNDPEELLRKLGWDRTNNPASYYNGTVSITTTDQEDFNTIKNKGDRTPSYRAVATLQKSQWAILTNGKKWRLYSSKISASSTNYFEISFDYQREDIIRYLIVLFGAGSFAKKSGKRDVDVFFDMGKEYSTALGNDLGQKIMSPDGLFLDLVKGVIDHDMTEVKPAVLNSAKDSALKIMYRIWFLAYAESRNLLPVKDEKYIPISLRFIKRNLDSYGKEPEGGSCWDSLLVLFENVREGSKKHNLPQYDGRLFACTRSIDGIKIKNKFISSALRGLLEQDGQAIDYANLGVRHLGNIFEALMEFSVKQAEKDLMLLEDEKGVREVSSQKESTYSYKKNDLYMISKKGAMARKTGGSFYTPNEIVKFLVERGLRPILKNREKLIAQDLDEYNTTKDERDRQTCIDRILDIQVLDPSMGSGHFLVEALNQITVWATGILDKHPEHPLLEEIESDRELVISGQTKKGITIEEDLLTHDVLLKRKVMKRCVFGVDVNPMAVDLAKLSLWLDSFAIGVPLTYMDHHIRCGDSTIGMWLKDRSKNVTEQTLDKWMKDVYSESTTLHDISTSADVTFDDIQKTRRKHDDYEIKIKPDKKMLDVLAAKHIDKDIAKNTPRDLSIIRDIADGSRSNDDRHTMVIKNTSALSKKFRFFHWEFEMMDAFTDARRGFDLLVTNPPWDKIRPNKNEFFSQFIPTYKTESSLEKKKTHEKYSDEFTEYEKTIRGKQAFWKKRKGISENTDFEIYRLILERILELVATNGMISVLLPSAILSSRGAKALRKHLLQHKILSIYEFENKKKIFPIDTRIRFVLLAVQNVKSNVDISAAFYLQDVGKLDNITKESFLFPKDTICATSPTQSIICAARDKQDIKILEKLFSSHPILENIPKWSVDLGRELNIGEKKDKKLLVEKNPKSWPVIESKDFHQHMWNFARSKYYADATKTLERTNSIRKFENLNEEIHENPRLAYRSISSSTNIRTMIASIIPPNVFTTINTYMAIPKIGELAIDSNYHRLNAYLCGIFNSMVFDYMIRVKIDKHVDTCHLYDTAIPENYTNSIACKIARLSAMLFLAITWHEDMANSVAISKNDLPNLTIKKYIEISSEIDALVAIHYRLTFDEYKHVLSSFKFNDEGLSDEELDQNVKFDDLEKGDRDAIMRRIFGQIHKHSPKFYEENLKAVVK